MKRLIRLVAILLIFVTSSANAFVPVIAAALIGGSIVGGSAILSSGARRSIDKLDDKIEHAYRRMDQLVDKVDEMLGKHIGELKGLAEDTIAEFKKIIEDESKHIDAKIDEIKSMVDKTITEVNKIEKDFFSDLEKSIEKVECTIDKTVHNHLQDALGNIGRMLDFNTIRIYPPILYPDERVNKYCLPCTNKCFVHKDVYKDFTIKTPFFSTTYDEIKEYLLNRLSGIEMDTPLDSAMMTYSVISELSKRAICYHKDRSRFINDYAFYKDRMILLQEFTQRYGGYEDDYDEEGKKSFWDRHNINFGDEL